MNGVQCKVRVLNLTSESYESHRCLRLGDELSCLLFNSALEGPGSNSKRFQDRSKCEIYRTLIHPVVLYGSPLRTGVLGHPSGRCKRSGRVWATHPSNHFWRCVRAWSVEEKDEVFVVFGKMGIDETTYR